MTSAMPPFAANAAPALEATKLWRAQKPFLGG
jgi:hypothetical protein